MGMLSFQEIIFTTIYKMSIFAKKGGGLSQTTPPPLPVPTPYGVSYFFLLLNFWNLVRFNDL